MAVRDVDFLSQIQYQMMETTGIPPSPDGGANWPSGLWTRDEVLSYANLRQNRFLKNAFLILSQSPPVPIAIGQHLVPLPTDWIRTAGVVWMADADGKAINVSRSDAFDADHNLLNWETQTGVKPLVYMDDDAVQTLQIQIAPAPNQTGTISFLYVKLAAEINGNGVFLTLEDEYEAPLRYGVIADMLQKDGRGRDPNRADYAEQRYALGIEAANIILKGWA